MPDLNIIPGDLLVQGRVVPASITMPSGSVSNDSVVSAAGVSASKLEHQHQITTWLAPHGTAAAATRYVMHVAVGAGTRTSFGAGATVAPTGADNVVVRLLKNGAAILSASITLDNANTNFVIEAGTISSAAYVAGDVFEAEIVSVSGTTAKGVFARLNTREAAQ